MIFREDLGTGYMYCYNPSHPTANAAGKVLEHVYVVFCHIGRCLLKGECVHHIDRNKKNNLLENLLLMNTKEHRLLHAKEDTNSFPIEKDCENCGKKFYTTSNAGIRYCTSLCYSFHSRKFNVTSEELSLLVWKYPTTKIGKMFGVSDVAVAKRCKLFKINKPPRGYWMKVRKTGTDEVDQ